MSKQKIKSPHKPLPTRRKGEGDSKGDTEASFSSHKEAKAEDWTRRRETSRQEELATNRHLGLTRAS